MCVGGGGGYALFGYFKALMECELKKKRDKYRERGERGQEGGRKKANKVKEAERNRNRYKSTKDKGRKERRSDSERERERKARAER